MIKIILKDGEELKYQIIKKLVDTNGNKNRAAVKLSCSRRTIDRLIKGYKEHGKAFFVHGNRGRKPTRTTTPEVRKTILNLFKEKYFDFTFKHFHEKLVKFEEIKYSYPTIAAILYSNGIISPKSQKKTKKRMKEALKIKVGDTVILEKPPVNVTVPAHEAHPRMPRSKYFGELVQMDASQELWFGNEKTQLHAAIDDSTGMIIGGYFDKEETLAGYYQITSQILGNYGIPSKFFTDRRTVFEYKKSGEKSVENDTFTQFGYACSQLGIVIQTSSVPQAKGRVERLFGTLQSRLIPELRLAGINDISSANAFLKEYIDEFNAEFAIKPDSLTSIFEGKIAPPDINLYLSVRCQRIVDMGHSIKYNNNFYFIVGKDGENLYIKPKTKVNVIKSLNGTLYASINDVTHDLVVIDKHERISPEFDSSEEIETPNNNYVPPLPYPWKSDSFNKYVGKVSRRLNKEYDDFQL